MVQPFDAASLKIRPEVRSAIDRAWRELGDTGAWLTGVERVGVAAEARRAQQCDYCQTRKSALSPYAVSGTHEHLGAVPEPWVHAIHPVITDPGRLTRRWYDEIRDAGVGEDEFVEILSVAIITVTVDSFAFGIGVAPPALPVPSSGTPSRVRASAAKPGPGWVATIAPEDAGPDFSDFYANESYFYIRRSLTLVPAEVRRFWNLMNPLYLADPRIHELAGVERAVSRAQMEFLAARTSALLGCYY